MRIKDLTPKGIAAVQQMIGIHNRIIEIQKTLSLVNSRICDVLKNVQGIDTGGLVLNEPPKYYFLNKTIWKHEILTDPNLKDKLDQIPGTINLNQDLTTPINHIQTRFIFNYVPFYIDYLITCETHSNVEIPIGNIVFGTFTVNEKDTDNPDIYLKPLVRFKVDIDSQTILSLDNHPDKIWNLKSIDDFLWRALASIWKDAIQLNNKSFLP